jgi:hypothetical protein
MQLPPPGFSDAVNASAGGLSEPHPADCTHSDAPASVAAVEEATSTICQAAEPAEAASTEAAEPAPHSPASMHVLTLDAAEESVSTLPAAVQCKALPPPSATAAPAVAVTAGEEEAEGDLAGQSDGPAAAAVTDACAVVTAPLAAACLRDDCLLRGACRGWGEEAADEEGGEEEGWLWL